MLQLELVYDVKVILLVSLTKNIWGCSWRNISINCNDNVSNIMVMCMCLRFVDCALNCAKCSRNGAWKCDRDQCNSGYKYNSYTKMCDGM